MQEISIETYQKKKKKQKENVKEKETWILKKLKQYKRNYYDSKKIKT